MQKMILVMLLALGIFSCTATSPKEAEFAVFLTDSFRDDVEHVWLKINRVELRDVLSSEFMKIYDNPEGRLIDAKTLRDQSGEKFSFLSASVAKKGTYNAVRVTFADQAQVVLAGQSLASTLTITNPVVTKNFSDFVVPGSALVIDLDLANFIADSSTLTVEIGIGNEANLSSLSRQKVENYSGVVSQLGSSSFLLTGTHGSVSVRFGDNVEVIDEESGRITTLTGNGIGTKVSGVFSIEEGVMSATKIVVENPADSEVYAEGYHEGVNLEANTMVLTNPRSLEGIVPQAFIHVHWNENTEFRKVGLLLDETKLSQYPVSQVKGSYDIESNTIEASRVTFENESEGTKLANVRGSATQTNLVTNSLLLTNLTYIEGFSPLFNLNLAWSDETLFLRNGQTASEYSLIGASTIRAFGIYLESSNTLMTNKVIVE